MRTCFKSSSFDDTFEDFASKSQKSLNKMQAKTRILNLVVPFKCNVRKDKIDVIGRHIFLQIAFL